MSHQVRWKQNALNQLTTLWTLANTILRQRITSATFRIDQRLQADPAREGESRSGDRRVLFEPPLAITYSIDVQSGVVYVLRVWTYRERK